MKTFDELIRYTNLICEEKSEVILCPSCNGIGSYTKETLVDYHRNDYDITRHNCSTCKGDGRIVQTSRTVSLRPETSKLSTPYNEFIGDKFSHTSVPHKVKIDNRDRYMEQKYPDLEALSYEKYDKMLTEIKITEALTKYENR